jgi:hypothetical protein
VVVAQAAAPPKLKATPASAEQYRWWEPSIGAEEAAHMLTMLRGVPELALNETREAAKTLKQARARVNEQVAAIQKQTAKDPDAFVVSLEKKRPDLAGLPLRKGATCTLDKEQARTLGQLSHRLRGALACSVQSSLSRTTFPPDPGIFWRTARLSRSAKTPTEQAAVRTLEQMLQAEHMGMRLSLVDWLRKVEGPTAGAVLARRVLFDPESEIRRLALASLSKRPAEEYTTVLLEGLRYPWAPVTARAAEALVSLQVTSSAPRLVDLLEQPDPTEPFFQEMNGKKVPVVRELVRVNHFRNCLLCHAPAHIDKDASGKPRLNPETFINQVTAPIPIPGEAFSPLERYFSVSAAAARVRADITYLRPDFSVLQPVENSGNWPALQRFDYVVRSRPLTKEEQTTWERQKEAADDRPISPQRRAVLFALCTLTGQDFGDAPAAWRRFLKAQAPAKTKGR